MSDDYIFCISLSDYIIIYYKDLSFRMQVTKFNSTILNFSALPGMHTRSSDENSVRLSVCQMREL